MARRAGLLALLALALPALAGSPAFERAQEAIADHRYAEARSQLQLAAEQGDRDAQRSLGLMLLYGEALYGPQVRADRAQARRWLQTASERGCEVSSFILKHMDAPGHESAGARTAGSTAGL